MKYIISLTIAIVTFSLCEAQPLTKGQLDTLRSDINARLEANPDAPATLYDVATMKTLAAYDILSQVRREMVSRTKYAKNGDMAKFMNYIDSLKSEFRNEADLLASGIGVLEGQSSEFNARVNDVEELITVEDALDQDEFTDAQKDILNKIRARHSAPVACNDGPKRY